jgi:transcriptional regulator with XRE-family HTH domain
MPGKTTDYDAAPFQELLKELLEEAGESQSKAARITGLHQTSISGYLRGTRPMRDACIALADHFGINPNVMLEAAGYASLHFFDRTLVDPRGLSPEAVDLARLVDQIEDRAARRRAIQAVRDLLRLSVPSGDCAVAGDGAEVSSVHSVAQDGNQE